MLSTRSLTHTPLIHGQQQGKIRKTCSLEEDKGGLKQKDGGQVERQGHALGKDESSTKNSTGV